MFRETPVTYSSLPQDEGTTPGSSFNGTSSGPTNPHNRRDLQLAAIITSVIIVTGLTLAATLPLVLKGKSEDLAGVDSPFPEDDDYWSSHLNGGQGESMTIKEPDPYYNGGDDTDSATEDLIPIYIPPTTRAPTQPATEAPATVKITTPKAPQRTTVPVVASVPSVVEGNQEPTGEELGPVVSEELEPTPKLTENYGGMGEVVSEKYPTGGYPDSVMVEDKDPVTDVNVQVNQEEESKTTVGYMEELNIDEAKGPATSKPEVVPEPDTHEPHSEEDDLDMSQLLDEIYGEEGGAKPSTLDNSSWMSNMLSTRDKLTLVVVAAIVAVAMGAVVLAVAWLVHSRITARRRRQSIQNVITDLQSRDKIVLLNSEESEEE